MLRFDLVAGSSVALALLLAGGCNEAAEGGQAAPTPAKSETKPEASTEPETKAPPTKAEVETKAEPETKDTDDEPTQAPPVATPATRPTFNRALVGDRPRLHSMADGELLISVGPQIYRVGKRVALVEDPALLAGLPAALSPQSGTTPQSWHWDLDINGRWPDGVFASYWVAPPPNSGPVIRPTYRWKDGRFEPLKLGRREYSFYYVDSRPYIDGSVLSLRRFQARPPKGVRWYQCYDFENPRCDARFAEVEAKARASKQLIVTRGLPKGPDLKKALGEDPPLIAAFDSLPSGFGVAATTFERPRLIVFSPAGAAMTVPPGKAGSGLRLHAVRVYAEDLAFAAGSDGDPFSGEQTARLYRYDGKAWSEEPAPVCRESGELAFFEQLKSGERFGLCNDLTDEVGGFPMGASAVWWQAPGEDWEALGQLGVVMARRGEHIWVADERGVFTTEAVDKELKASAREDLERKLFADGPPGLALDETW